jgi:hypothetical protein
VVPSYCHRMTFRRHLASYDWDVRNPGTAAVLSAIAPRRHDDSGCARTAAMCRALPDSAARTDRILRKSSYFVRLAGLLICGLSVRFRGGSLLAQHCWEFRASGFVPIRAAPLGRALIPF